MDPVLLPPGIDYGLVFSNIITYLVAPLAVLFVTFGAYRVIVRSFGGAK